MELIRKWRLFISLSIIQWRIEPVQAFDYTSGGVNTVSRADGRWESLVRAAGGRQLLAAGCSVM
jgi:hypothetical protein